MEFPGPPASRSGDGLGEKYVSDVDWIMSAIKSMGYERLFGTPTPRHELSFKDFVSNMVPETVLNKRLQPIRTATDSAGQRPRR